MHNVNHTPGFDREQAITRWRESLLARESVTAENVRELEGHLREGMSGLTARGLSEEEAFLIASRRMGGTETIAAEFEANDPHAKWRHRAFWIVAGLLFGQAWFGLWTTVGARPRGPLDGADLHWWFQHRSALAAASVVTRCGLVVLMAGVVLTIRLLVTGRLTSTLKFLSTRCHNRWFLWLCALSPAMLTALIYLQIRGTGRFENPWDNFLYLSWPVVLAVMLVALVPNRLTNRPAS
jgi:hypothetical protein